MLQQKNNKALITKAEQFFDESINTLNNIRAENIENFNFNVEYVMCKTINEIRCHKKELQKLDKEG